MMFLKVSDYILTNGYADYKGLDIDKIVPGTQVYDHLGDRCIFGYDGDFPVHPEIIPLTLEQYEAEKADIIMNIPKTSDQIAQEQTQAQIDALTLEILTLKGMVYYGLG